MEHQSIAMDMASVTLSSLELRSASLLHQVLLWSFSLAKLNGVLHANSIPAKEDCCPGWAIDWIEPSERGLACVSCERVTYAMDVLGDRGRNHLSGWRPAAVHSESLLGAYGIFAQTETTTQSREAGAAHPQASCLENG